MDVTSDPDDGISSLTSVEACNEVVKVSEIVEKFLSRKLVQVQNTMAFDQELFHDILLSIEMAKVCVGFPVSNAVTVEKLAQDFESWKVILTEDIVNFRRHIELAMQKGLKRHKELLNQPS